MTWKEIPDWTMEKKFKENREGYEEPQNKGVAEGDEVD
jgi:hypothetical protein